MKQIISLIALIALGFSASAQQTTWSILPASIYNNSLTQVAADTMKGVDTTYLYWQFSAPYRLSFILTTVQKADSLTGTAILQGSDDNTNWTTRSSGYWESVTGLTSLCTTCVGSSKTFTVATGTNKSTWDIGFSELKYWRIRIVGTRSTDTTAVTGTANYGY